jgi:hypothetical protein
MIESAAFISTASLVYATLSAFLPAAKYTKVGGLRFVRLGRVQLSFCFCRKG